MAELSHAELVERAVRCLRRRCLVAFAEITTAASETPDAIGWRQGVSTMIECKASRSDFLADRRKGARRSGFGVGRRRYYMVPKGLVRPDELPERWGLLEVTGRRVLETVRAQPFEPADVNHREECAILVSAVRRHELGVRWDGRRGRFATYAETHAGVRNASAEGGRG